MEALEEHRVEMTSQCRMGTIKVAPISNVRLTSSLFVFTSLSWRAGIFRLCSSISMHMRLRVKERHMERHSQGGRRRFNKGGEML